MVLRVNAEEKKKTKAKAAMIPNELIENIDVWVKDGYYSSRADFMYCAIRFFIERNFEECYAIYKEIIDYNAPHEVKVILYNEKVKNFRIEAHEAAAEWLDYKDKEKTQIMIKQPDLIDRLCEQYYRGFDDLKTFQNLAIVSIVTLLFYLEERFGYIDELGAFLERPRRDMKEVMEEIEKEEKMKRK